MENQEHPDMVEQMLKVLKALADASRLKILGLLAGKEMNVGKLAEKLQLSEPTVSHHLARLSDADIVSVRQSGTARIYTLNMETLHKFSQQIDNPETLAPAANNQLSAETQRILKSFIVNGKIIKIPEMLKKKRVILQWLIEQMPTDKRYTEKEISKFLQQYHDDFASLRRELIDLQFMQRENSVYWRA